MKGSFTEFGKMRAGQISRCLFWVGTALSAFSSFIFGKYLFLTNTYDKGISYMQNGQRWYTEKPVNNLPLGVGGAIVSFLISILLWKIACEVLYLIVRCMETYLEKKNEHTG